MQICIREWGGQKKPAGGLGPNAPPSSHARTKYSICGDVAKSEYSVTHKIFEKILFNKIYEHLTKNNLITPNQSGFRPGDGCINQLLYLVTEIYESFESPEKSEIEGKNAPIF